MNRAPLKRENCCSCRWSKDTQITLFDTRLHCTHPNVTMNNSCAIQRTMNGKCGEPGHLFQEK